MTELESLAEKDAETYGKIWDAFGRVLKEGLYEDHERRGQMLALARFATTAGERPRSLKQYVADLKPNQTEIYYLVGESAERLKANPKLEAARARGIEVLLLTDPVDAFWTAMPQDFEGKPLKSLSQGEVDFGLVPLLEKAAEQKPASDEDAAVIAAVKDALGEQVSEVRASQRLTESAACLVAGAQASIASWSACLRARIAAAARSRSSSSTCATSWCRRWPPRRRKARDGGCGISRAAARPGPHPRRRGAGRSRSLCQAAQCVRRPGAARRRVRRALG